MSDRLQVPRVLQEALGQQLQQHAPRLEETGPLSQGVQAGRKAIRLRRIDGMEVRKKRPRGSK